MTYSKASKTLQTLGMIMKIPQFSAKNVPKVENSSGKKKAPKNSIMPLLLPFYRSISFHIQWSFIIS